MKRSDILSLLKDVENSKEICDKILGIHNAEINEAKQIDETKYISIEEYNALNEKYNNLNGDLDKFKDYDELVKFKDETTKKEVNVKKTNAVLDLLKENKASEKAINLLVKQFDLNEIELDDKGKVINATDKLNKIKTDYVELFTTEAPGGAQPALTGATDTDNEFSVTKEQFSKMGYNERVKLQNENPNVYKKLKGE